MIRKLKYLLCSSVSKMASGGVKNVVHKLHAVTLVKSGIRQPWWEKRTLKALRLTKLNKTIIHKNTPTVNGQLKSVQHLIKVRPVVIDEKGGEYAAKSGDDNLYLRHNGVFHLKKLQEFQATKTSTVMDNEMHVESAEKSS